MKINGQLEKLRRQQQLLVEALKQAEAKASVRQRKAETRVKIILGGALLSLPEGERDALFPMLLPRMTERDRRFVSDHLAGDQSPVLLSNQGSSQLN